jgi:prepilin-type N-terminal cleavage/methylation domain-containing protein
MPSPRRAFTLLELLVVIGIIAVLIAVTFMVGGAVSTNSKKSLTQDTIRVLDGALAAYIGAKGGLPPAYLDDPRSAASTYVIPVADARNMDLPDNANSPQQSTIINSVALFVAQCQSVPEAKAALDRLPSKVAVSTTVSLGSPNPNTGFQLTTVNDGWGRPIRYVHPAFSVGYPVGGAGTSEQTANLISPPPGKQWSIQALRRVHGLSVDPRTMGSPRPSDYPDSDGGRCPGGRPYFYSAGEDGLVGHIEPGINLDADNVYTVAPTTPRD